MLGYASSWAISLLYGELRVVAVHSFSESFFHPRSCSFFLFRLANVIQEGSVNLSRVQTGAQATFMWLVSQRGSQFASCIFIHLLLIRCSTSTSRPSRPLLFSRCSVCFFGTALCTTIDGHIDSVVSNLTSVGGVRLPGVVL